MGAVVTKSVPDFHLIVGSPARSVAAVCRCGQPLHRFNETDDGDDELGVQCCCDRSYAIHQQVVSEVIGEAGDQRETD